MRNKKGEGLTTTEIILLIIALIVLVFFILLLNKHFNWFASGTKCTGYCIEKQEDCTTGITHEDSYCTKQTNAKALYCCVDPAYKGDPAAKFKAGGNGGGTGTGSGLSITSSSGETIDLKETVVFSAGEQRDLIFKDNRKEAGNCKVYIWDSEARKAMPVINGMTESTFECNKGATVGFKFSDQDATNKNLQLQVIVYDKGKTTHLASNSQAVTIMSEANIPQPMSLNLPSAFESYFGLKYPAIDILKYVNYGGDNSKLLCEFSYTAANTNGYHIGLTQSTCTYEISYNPVLRAEQRNEIEFKVTAADGSTDTDTTNIVVKYSPDIYCRTFSNPNYWTPPRDVPGWTPSKCTEQGCSYVMSIPYAGYDKKVGQCYFESSVAYCNAIATEGECSSEQGNCQWNNDHCEAKS